MQHIRARLRSPEKDDVQDARHTSGLYEKLYRKYRAPTSSSSYLVLGLRDKIGGDREAIEACYRFVMKDTDKQLFLEDFKNVKRLTIFRFYSGSLRADCIPLLPQMFVGLEELVLEMTEKLYLEDAIDLKSVLDNMKVKISVMINRRRFPQDSKAILGSYISHDYFNFGDITMLTGMKELLIDFGRAPSNDTALPNVAASLTSLKVESMMLHNSDAIAEFLKSNGVGLKKLRLSGYVYAQDQDLATENMEKLLEVIEDSCDKLKVLEISYHVKHSIYVRFLEHYLEKRGHCLKNLQITSACLTNGMVDVISRCCKKLKILYLVGIHSDDLDVEMCYEKTKTLSKLEAVTFRIKYD
ncbi:hypothetical protein HDE_10869 [Halotydeus destructor]|nr:hypothetical protein HDE_10869 [Halotydeus destructor]